MRIANQVPSVNYHLWKPCNMKCGFCFATFQDIHSNILPKGHLGREDCLSVVESLAQAGFRKINFAGGEPTLCPWLPDLIRWAKILGLTTSVVTNGSRITAEWLKSVNGSLDWVALSIDSVNPSTLSRTGRETRSGPMSEHDYLRAIDILKQHLVRVKINTVVTQGNLQENLADFILKARPERWKLLQVLPVKGQNDHTVGKFVVSTYEFDDYVRSNRWVEAYGITVVPENNDLMTGSYVMVDPAGRFFDNVAGDHTYSRSIIKGGVEEALRDVSVDPEKFLSRNGRYDW
ncbi:MAG: viperin family antiviral radical SAM protein [Chloroflexota bacterium]|nr:viperin family antiviral radical SAM protein [Chloroflexota bacterium]MDE2930437.1 viperin family antiviral radical SAM protein [Chloroflexota bacterium]